VNGSAAAPKNVANYGTAAVPDDRIDFLSGLYRPRKTTYAKIDFTDIAGLTVSGDDRNAGTSRFLNGVRPCEALVHVLRAFRSDSVFHDLDIVDPARDLEAVEDEMLFADLELVEKRIGRIKDGKKISRENADELLLLERCYDFLEKNGAIREMDLLENERAAIHNYAFLTDKPRIAVINLDEAQWKSKTWPNQEALQSLLNRLNIPLLVICEAFELEISQLPESDRKAFMDDMGIEEPGIAALAKAVYNLLDLISFLTVGEDEVKAWTIANGTNARTAAGKIHSDIARGFIRAEVMNYKDIKAHGSVPKVKEKGLFRLEGKEYVIADGDVISFRFNI
jgi:GTP-binding protein YchF